MKKSSERDNDLNRSPKRGLNRRLFLQGSCAAAFSATIFAPPAFLAATRADVAFDFESCPYAVHAHLDGNEEFENVPRNLEMMRAAGIRWVRVDVRWSAVEPKEGVWNYDRFDAVLDAAERAGIQVLPLLGFGVS